MDKSRRCVLALGPKGSYSYLAAQKLGNDASIETVNSLKTQNERFLSDAISCGVFPLYNSQLGFIEETTRLFLSSVYIHATIALSVEFVLVGTPRLSDAKKVFVQKYTFEYCSSFIKQYLPHVEIVIVESNSLSGQLAKEDKSSVAIVPKPNWQQFSLPIQSEGLEVAKESVTTFALFSHEKPKPCENCFLLFIETENKESCFDASCLFDNDALQASFNNFTLIEKKFGENTDNGLILQAEENGYKFLGAYKESLKWK